MAETKDRILERINNELPDRYAKNAGTYTYDINAAFSEEFANAYDEIDEVERQSHPSTATGEKLGELVQNYGMEGYKNATISSGEVTLRGDTSAVAPAGSKVAAGNVIFSITDEATIGAEGTVTVGVIADVAGSQGNVSAGAINRFPITIPGFIGVTNSSATMGGSDAETTEQLRERWYDYVAHPVVSCNKWWYIATAKEVDGVGDAKCIPLWNGNGTVKVIIVDMQKNRATEALIQTVEDYLAEKQDIGVTLTVTTATEKQISLSCHLVAANGADTAVTAALESYLKDVSFTEGYISYAEIGRIIKSTDGVTDYTDLLVNNGRDNISIADTEIAVLGGVDYD